MNAFARVASALALAALLAGCGDDSENATASTTSGAGGAGHGGSASTSTSPSSASGAQGASTSSTGGATCSGFPIPPMPLLSRDAPAFASNGSDAAASNDDNPASQWQSNAMPAWIAYDLSAAPEAERQQVLVAWYAIHSGCYIDESSGDGQTRPVSYTIESNSAPGGGSPPESGWTTLTNVSGGSYCGRHHLVDMGGASWIRMNVTEGTDPTSVGFDLDVHAVPGCLSDDWLFMGDSITYMSTTYAFSDLPDLVHAAKPEYDPAVIDAAIGGTNTGTALLAIDDTMKDFPGRFVVLAYGTNDHAGDFHMEELVQKVIAAGKTPVVPHMPWSASASEGPAINAQIDALYQAYPALVPGPDLWAVFLDRTDLIPENDIHPNAEGQEELRKAWAETMSSLDE